MVVVIDNVLGLLADFGFFRVVLPFLLIFAVFYAILMRTQIFGDLEKNRGLQSIVTIISLAAAFMVIAYTPVVDALAKLIPQASFLIVATMLFLMVAAFIFPKWFEKDAFGTEAPWMLGLVGLILFIIFLGIAGSSVGDNIPILRDFTKILIGTAGIDIGPELANTLLGLGIVIGIPVLVIAFIVWSGRREPTQTPPAH